MFGISFGELTLLLVIALLVVGPERLPEVVRTVGKFVGKLRGYSDNFRADLEREFKLSEIKEDLTQVRQKAELDQLQRALRDVAEKGEAQFNRIEASVEGGMVEAPKEEGKLDFNFTLPEDAPDPEAYEDALFADDYQFEFDSSEEMSEPPAGFQPERLQPQKSHSEQNPWRKVVGIREESLIMEQAPYRQYLTYHLNQARLLRPLKSEHECELLYRARLLELNKPSKDES